MTRRRIAQLVLLLAALATYLLLARQWPKDQVLHFSFGDAASRVDELRVRYGETNRSGGAPAEWSRAAEFRYRKGQAPRVATHETRLPDGNYTVEIEIGAAAETATVTRKVDLEGGSVTIELSRDVPQPAP